MAENLKPLVLSPDGTKHISAQPGDKLDSSYIDKKGLISDESGNLLSVDANGKLFVAGKTPTTSDLVSSSLGNSITLGTDQRLYAKAVSTDANNLIKRGGDNGAHLGATDIISVGSTENLLSVNPVDHRIQVTEGDVKRVIDSVSKNVQVVSTESGNIIRTGNDGGAYLTNDDLQNISVQATDKILSLNGEVLSATVAMTYDAGTGYLYLNGKNNEQLSTVYIPGASSSLVDVGVEKNPQGYEPGKYFKYIFSTAGGRTVIYVPIPACTAIEGGNGISVGTADDVATISVKVAENSGLIAGPDGLKVDPDLIGASEEVKNLTERVTANEGDIAVLKTDTVAITVSNETVNPTSLKLGEGVLYPAENLL